MTATPGDRSVRKAWTADEVEQLLAMHAEKVSLEKIAQHFGCSPHRVKDKLRLVYGVKTPARVLSRGLKMRRANLDNGQMRPCMHCQKPFLSEGIHNRMCAICKAGS